MNRLILLAFMTGTLLQACSLYDSIVGPDTSGPVLETPQMWCTYEQYNLDTLTISWEGLNSLPEFFVRAIRIDSLASDTVVVMDNRIFKFWFNDRLISSERWLHPGSYRIELVAHDTKKVLGSATPNLTVRWLRIDSVSATDVEIGSIIKVSMYLPIPTPRSSTGDYFYPGTLSAWMDDSELPLIKQTVVPYMKSFFYSMEFRANTAGSGQLLLKDAKCKETALGPRITIRPMSMTKYFKRGEVALTLDLLTTYDILHTVSTLTIQDTTFTVAIDSITGGQLMRSCTTATCDTVTRVDTTKFTTDNGAYRGWQARIVIDTTTSSFKQVLLFVKSHESGSQKHEGWGGTHADTLIFENVPASQDADGSWSALLTGDAFNNALRYSVMSHVTGWYELPSSQSFRQEKRSIIQATAKNSLRLTLHPR